jgi:hypothetical protein
VKTKNVPVTLSEGAGTFFVLMVTRYASLQAKQAGLAAYFIK